MYTWYFLDGRLMLSDVVQSRLGLFMDAFILSKIPGSERTETTGYLAQQDLFDLVRRALPLSSRLVS